jgi:hypothetical protein
MTKNWYVPNLLRITDIAGLVEIIHYLSPSGQVFIFCASRYFSKQRVTSRKIWGFHGVTTQKTPFFRVTSRSRGSYSPACFWIPVWITLWKWRQRLYFPSKRLQSIIDVVSIAAHSTIMSLRISWVEKDYWNKLPKQLPFCQDNCSMELIRQGRKLLAFTQATNCDKSFKTVHV